MNKGRTRIATSVSRFDIVIAEKSIPILTQVPLTVALFQLSSMGVHWKMVGNNPPIPQLIQIAATTYMDIRKARGVNILEYSARIDNLVGNMQR